MPELEDEDRDVAIVKGHAAQLAEHFDSVQVFVSRPCEDGTINCNQGSGNWFARYGQVRSWVIQEEERFRNPAREED